MTPERWQEIKNVLAQALEIKPAERAAFLDRSCSGDSSLRREVELLLASDEAVSTEFLNKSPGLDLHTSPNTDADGSPAEPADVWMGRRVGPYKIVEQIGAGGMGEVYRAFRADDQYRKEVALKVMRAGQDSEFFVSRFKNERQILANLDHPNIAGLLDGGSTEDARPYLVMEYIRGRPLDRYCDDCKLTVTERVRLFRIVCSAVQCAHQNLVIHRDIKPSNILVTEDGSPKLLDFGIAKLLAPDSESAQPLQTVTMVRLLTPEYASPEQLRGETITTASDIYSLGVVLYEILTGRRPRLRENRVSENGARIPAEIEPERPSTAVSRAGKDANGLDPLTLTPEIVSATREGSPEKLRRRLAGDLDNIVLMALRPEPRRRYASVEQLSEDLRRHLEGLPVIARTDTFGYRSSKFIRRHTAGLAAAALLALSLIGGMAATLWEAHIARDQRGRAERRFNDVRKLANALMFDIHDAIRDLPGSTRARQLLVTNALKYLDSLAGEARGDLSLQRELADAYERVGAVQGQPYTASLGDAPGALASYLKAQAIRKTIATVGTAPDQIKYAANCRAVASLQLVSSDAAAAIRTAQESVSITQSLLKNDPANRDALAELAGDYSAVGFMFEQARTGSANGEDKAGENYRRALEIDDKLTESSTDKVLLRNLATDEFHIGQHLRDAGYRAEAIEAFNRALGILGNLAKGSDSTQTLRDMSSATSALGDTFLMNGDATHALANYRKILDAVVKVSAADPNNGDARSGVGEASLNVGVSLVMLGKASDALSYLTRAMAIFEKIAAADPKQQGVNWDLTVAYVWTASVSPDANRALEYFDKALAIDQRLAQVDTGTSNWQENEAEVRVNLGDFFRKHSQLDRAAENYGRAAAIIEPVLASHPDQQEPRYPVAGAYFGLGEIAALKAQRPSQSRNEQKAKWNEANSWYQRSADAWRQIRHPAAVSPNGFDCGNPQEGERELSRSKAALAELGS
jgi:eukaryotic-like serine/threonine-protein kinase